MSTAVTGATANRGWTADRAGNPQGSRRPEPAVARGRKVKGTSVAIAAPEPALGDEPFLLQVTARADGVEVVLRGPLDLGTASDIRQLGIALRGTAGPVVLDLADLTFIDSTGITALVSLKGELDLQLRSLQVRHLRPETLDLLRMVGVDELLGVRD
jgi:anti-anti-sigma factor